MQQRGVQRNGAKRRMWHSLGQSHETARCTRRTKGVRICRKTKPGGFRITIRTVLSFGACYRWQ
eukprot:3417669-Karenia_brevis.AAC.1